MKLICWAAVIYIYIYIYIDSARCFQRGEARWTSGFGRPCKRERSFRAGAALGKSGDGPAEGAPSSLLRVSPSCTSWSKISPETGERTYIHHHRGDPPSLLFPGLRLYGVYPSFQTYGVYPFPLFSQENGIHHSFFCSVTSGLGDRPRKEGSHSGGVYSFFPCREEVSGTKKSPCPI